MMKISDWFAIYSAKVDLVIRNIKYKKEHDESFDEDITFLLELHEFESDLFKHVVLYDFDITYAEWTDLCNKYISKFKKDNSIIAQRFFNLWSSGRIYLNGYDLKLGEYRQFLKSATRKEIKQARKDFGSVEEDFYGEVRTHSHTFKDDAKVLEYRGQRFIIDSEWCCAWAKNKKGEVRSFSLDWDWWYPIDKFISLEL